MKGDTKVSVAFEQKKNGMRLFPHPLKNIKKEIKNDEHKKCGIERNKINNTHSFWKWPTCLLPTKLMKNNNHYGQSELFPKWPAASVIIFYVLLIIIINTLTPGIFSYEGCMQIF